MCRKSFEWTHCGRGSEAMGARGYGALIGVCASQGEAWLKRAISARAFGTLSAGPGSWGVERKDKYRGPSLRSG
jgi:hypothetical protein